MNIHANAVSTPKTRLLMCTRVIEQGWHVADAAAAAGLSVRRAYVWLRRYRAEGEAGLRDRSSAPRHSPRRTPERTVAMITALRRLRMSAVEIAEALGLAARTVSRVLARAGLQRLRWLEPPEPANRYERARAGELIHVDVKKLGVIDGVGHRASGSRVGQRRGRGWEFVHVAVDDASRLAYVEVLADERAETCAGFLRRAVRFYALHAIAVERVLTDNGSAYRSRHWRARCRRLGIRHTRTRPYRPRTNGKAERFIKTLTERWAYGAVYGSSVQRTHALAGWVRFYNHQRPHRSLDLQTPAERAEALVNNVMASHS
jgi:transposase InsO family protein